MTGSTQNSDADPTTAAEAIALLEAKKQAIKAKPSGPWGKALRTLIILAVLLAIAQYLLFAIWGNTPSQAVPASWLSWVVSFLVLVIALFVSKKIFSIQGEEGEPIARRISVIVAILGILRLAAGYVVLYQYNTLLSMSSNSDIGAKLPSIPFPNPIIPFLGVIGSAIILYMTARLILSTKLFTKI